MFDSDSMQEIMQVFYEESDEGLVIMESGLLKIKDLGEADVELINDIFRAAHSIKGGSGTFGMTNIAEFTHGVETLLDEMRAGSRDVDVVVMDVLLKSVDCIRDMFDAAREGTELDEYKIEVVNATIKWLLGEIDLSATKDESSDDNETTDTASDESSETETSEQKDDNGWDIVFKPAQDFLHTGNKLELIFRELANLGELSLCADLDSLPELDSIKADDCYVNWSCRLLSDCEEGEIKELFEWVEDDCELSIEKIEVKEEASTTTEDTNESKEEEHNSQEEQNNSQTEVTPQAEPSESVKPVAAQNTNMAAAAAAGKSKAVAKPTGSIRVSIEKIDNLLNLVGELVITQSILDRYTSRLADEEASTDYLEELRDGLFQLESNARELQEVAMDMRMLPIRNSFSRFPRLVHDLSSQLGKKIELKIVGEQTEVDKTVLEKISDPLVHLVRNSLDHGIETPEERLEAGKSEVGTLELKAFHEAGSILIQIIDDGAGLNTEKILEKARERGLVGENEELTEERIHNLIFQPGFSTAEQISDVSGRGVGMDVVRRNINDLGGRVDVQSQPKKGSVFTIRLPLTLAILDGQLVQVGDESYVVPLLSIIESVVIKKEFIHRIAGDTQVYRLRENFIPMADLVGIFGGVSRDEDALANKLLVIVEVEGRRYGLVVDDLQEQQQVVIKSLGANYKNIAGLSGATILGDGMVALIIDVISLVDTCFKDLGDLSLDFAEAS